MWRTGCQWLRVLGELKNDCMRVRCLQARRREFAVTKKEDGICDVCKWGSVW